MASLTIVTGPNQGDYYPFTTRTMVIGRDEACPIQIVDAKASRKHLQVRFDATRNQHIACDMQSSNGTLLNNNKLTAETPLKDGDEMVIGDSTLWFSTTDFPDKQSAMNQYHQRGERNKPTLQQR